MIVLFVLLHLGMKPLLKSFSNEYGIGETFIWGNNKGGIVYPVKNSKMNGNYLQKNVAPSILIK